MKKSLYVLLTAAVLFFAGCGILDEDDAGVAVYRFFNARHVNERMAVGVKSDASELFSVSLGYAQETFRRVDWKEGDRWDIRYRQDFVVSYEGIRPAAVMKIMVAIGNSAEQNDPVIFDGPSAGDTDPRRALVKVVNAMRGDVRDGTDALRLHLNNSGDYETALLILGETSGEWYSVAAGENSLIEVKDRYGNFRNTSTDSLFAGHAYLIVIYENRAVTGEPKVSVVDVTP